MVLGSAIGLSLTPLFAVSPRDIPILNVVWLIPLALTLAMAIVVFVCHGQPPTPPSKSEEVFAKGPKISYLEK